MKKIYYAKPSITTKEMEYVNDAIKTGWAEKCYDYIFKFENIFSKYLGAKHSIATSSCTGALHLALAALGITRNEEVIVPDITWIASVAPIVYLGAKPVFVDVLPNTWCIDPEKIKKAITKKTKAIIAVHLYGNLAEMDEILTIGKQYGIPVIEDAAEALGSEYKKKKAGSIADCAVFSFHGTKTITSGEGGMFVTSNSELLKKIKILADHGRNSENPKQFWCEQIGFKYKMSNLQAALGFAQMERINELVKRKREIFFEYKKNLCKIQGLSFNEEQNYSFNSYWMPTIIFDKSLNIDRDAVIKEFQKNNIDGRVFFYPISSLPMFKPIKQNKVSYDIFYRGINLPTYFEIDSKDIKRVTNIIKKNIKNKI